MGSGVKHAGLKNLLVIEVIDFRSFSRSEFNLPGLKIYKKIQTTPANDKTSIYAFQKCMNTNLKLVLLWELSSFVDKIGTGLATIGYTKILFN